MCASSVGCLLSTAVQRDNHGVLPVLVTWPTVLNLTALGSGALKLLASKKTKILPPLPSFLLQFIHVQEQRG